MSVMKAAVLSAGALLSAALLVEIGPVATGSSGSTAIAATSGGGKSGGDVAAGKKIFEQNCSGCHGTTGEEGGVGPSLKNESKRKNFDQTVAWIKNPKAPMPKLYPSPLNQKDVNDVAAYVQSLH